MSEVVETIDGRMATLVDPSASLETLATGYRSLEGPVWIPHDEGYLMFSEIRGMHVTAGTARELARSSTQVEKATG